MTQWNILMSVCVALVYFGTGCTHNIALHPTDTSWHHTVEMSKQPGAALTAVIDEHTAKASYDFRAWSTGIAHKWVAQYGEMLEQVADVELPQLAEFYQRTNVYSEPTTGRKRLTLVLAVPSYTFDNHRAKLTVHAEAFSPGRQPIFSKSYTSAGGSEAGKMWGLGAFGQKSAVRQSSLEAFQDVFEQMRPDIIAALQGRDIAAVRSRGNPHAAK